MRPFRWIFPALLLLTGSGLAQQGKMPPLPPITEPASGEFLPGKFVWADLFSNDTGASRRFYARVFDWQWRQIDDSPTPYGVFYMDDQPVAGLAHREAPDGGDSYGRWVHYISVADVGASELAIGKQEGQILLNRRTHADRGDFAIVADLHGAPFGILRSSSGDPGDFRAAFGEWIWHELFTRDLNAAIGFYTELFAYESEKDERNPEIMDYLLKSHGYLRAGIGALPPDSDTAPTWLGYVRVEDVNAVLDRVRANGGKVLLEPKPEIAGGGLAIVVDPTGAKIGLLQWDYDDAGNKEMQP